MPLCHIVQDKSHQVDRDLTPLVPRNGFRAALRFFGGRISVGSEVEEDE